MNLQYLLLASVCIIMCVQAEEKSELKKIFGYIFTHPEQCKRFTFFGFQGFCGAKVEHLSLLQAKW